jgi:DNA-binding PadR family transcriptional regulator
MADLTMLYKLIVLYMLDRVDFPLTNSQISEFMLGKEYTSYFTLQQILTEMADSNLIQIEATHNRSLYHLTEQGCETLHFFENKISDAIRADIEEYLETKHYDLKNETAVISDYYQNNSGEYYVRCQIREGNTYLVDITLKAASEKDAEAIVTNWYAQNQEIYAMLLGALL